MTYTTKLTLIGLLLAGGCDQGDGVEIGPRGGIVVSEDGRFSLEIPEGALDHEVLITIDVLDEAECEQDASVGPCYEVGPVGLPLLYPGTVVYELDHDMLDGVDVDSLTVLTEREEDWKPLADREVDMIDETVTASALYLSAYAVVVRD